MATQGISTICCQKVRKIGVCAGTGVFCLGGVKRAKGDIVGPLLSGDHGQMAAVMAGHTQYGALLHQRSGIGDRAVILSDMGAIRAKLGHQIGAVIEQDGDTGLLRHGDDAISQREQLRIGRGCAGPVLQPDLEAGDITACEGLGELGGEGVQIGDDGRRDEIEAADMIHGEDLA